MIRYYKEKNDGLDYADDGYNKLFWPSVIIKSLEISVWARRA